MTSISQFIEDESGATAIEYSLIAALIGVALVSVLTKLGAAIVGKFQTINSRMISP
ncbi:MAG: Flp family type IVb pilin [Methylobacteriaceae bacterium]|nr:Flp family type IVb pilin [Rhodoblastus sp.]MCB9999474.1 Flp family type IVb pilin [Methylobacteriaceae bacterium]MCC0001751.1 Flp family type IVb pilin [Methylobacteriaceae bacterium]MCO5087472.1 Flp family type IVb pilin [Methylobacteriaceae bacterium]